MTRTTRTEFRWPALGLKLTALVRSLFAVGQLVLAISEPRAFIESQGFLRRDGVVAYEPSPEVVLIGMAAFTVLELGISAVIFLGASNMERRRNWNFALGASIVAMIPCASCCCLMGIPFGIWALVALTRPGVRESFAT